MRLGTTHLQVLRRKTLKLGVICLVLSFIALALSLPASAAPNPSSGTLEAYVKLSDILDNHTIFSAPQDIANVKFAINQNSLHEFPLSEFSLGSETAGGLVGYWRFNNDSAVGEAYNGTNASVVYLVNPSGFIRNYESIDSQFDYSGEGNNGVNYNGTYNASGGRFSGAFMFDGNDNV